MVLSKHIDPDELTERYRRASLPASIAVSSTPYGSRYSAETAVPKYKLPDTGMNADAAYRLISDELDFDGKPNLNMASFVHTYMEPMADRLIKENLAKNLSDADEYPAMMEIHSRCISMLAHLWGIPKGETAIGSATTGSSEAIHLGGLAMKRRWVEKRMAEGKDYSKPNVIMGANAQVAIEKFARYFDVEARILPVSAKSQYRLDTTKILENVDENTIGVFVILGSTYTGHYEDVKGVSDELDKYQEKTGQDVPIHVDGASGAMFAPFVHKSLTWGFELPRVKSINTSGHKYGLVYAGLGWILWRSEAELPKHLIFELHYLGGTESSYTLNFSRPGAQMLAQYFNFIHLGLEGYETIQHNDLVNARILSAALEGSGHYTCLSDIHRPRGHFGPHSVPKNYIPTEDDAEFYNLGLPVVAFRLSDQYKKKYPHVKQAGISSMLRMKGWILPNYPCPPDEQDVEILRAVIRESFSTDMCDKLVADCIQVADSLANSDDAVLDQAMGGLTVNSERRKMASLGPTKGSHHEAKEHHRHTGVFRAAC